MTQVSASALTLVRQILSHEAKGSLEPDMLVEAAGRVEMRLREHLAELVGLLGYTTLCARALRLAQAEIPALEHITVNVESGNLLGMHDFVEVARATIDDPHAAEIGLTAFLAYVIALLGIFIGEDLAFRLVREGWPDLGHAQVALEG